MTSQPPGTRLHRWLATRMDRATFAALIEPTIADLQHEVEAAGDRPWPRRLAIARGYAAVLRVLAGHGFAWGGVLRRWGVVAAMGLAGALLMTWSQALHSEARITRSAFVFPMLLTPLVLRLSGAAAAFRPLMRAAIAAGMLMCLFGQGTVFIPGATVVLNIVRFVVLFLIVAFFASVGVSAAAVPHTFFQARRRQSIVAALAAASAAACVVLLRQAIVGPYEPRTLVAMTPFFVTFLAVVQLPAFFVTFIVSAVMSRATVALTLVGALCFPISTLVAARFDGGGISEVVGYLRFQPVLLLWHGLPFLIGGAVFGWMLARPIRAVQVAQPVVG